MNTDITTITATVTALAAAANARAKTEAERIAAAFTRGEHAPIARVVERVNEGHAIDRPYSKPTAEEIAVFANLRSYTVEIDAAFTAEQQERIDARLATLKAAGITTTVEAYQGNWKQHRYAGVDARNEDGTRRVFVATVSTDINTRSWIKGTQSTVIEVTTRVLPFSESDRVIESTVVISAGVDHSAPFATEGKFLKRAAENASIAAGRYTYGIAGLDRLIAEAATRVARRDEIAAVQKTIKAYNGEGWGSNSTFPKAKTDHSRKGGYQAETRLSLEVYNADAAKGEVSETGNLKINEVTPSEALALIEFLKALRNA
jgi:DNA-binding transcriptional ArsR family regulator